jgi:hypothetical protein
MGLHIVEYMYGVHGKLVGTTHAAAKRCKHTAAAAARFSTLPQLGLSSIQS